MADCSGFITKVVSLTDWAISKLPRDDRSKNRIGFESMDRHCIMVRVYYQQLIPGVQQY
jgi:hypothetical protein